MAFNNNKGEHRFPFDITIVDPDVNTELLEFCHGERKGFVQVGQDKYFFPWKYKDAAEAFYNFEARSTDVWITTVPRSGTTWTQEMVWLIANDLNFKKARDIPLTHRFPFFEFSNFVGPEVKNQLQGENAGYPEKLEFIEKIARPGYEFLKEITEQRFIKTHFPFSLLPPSVMEKQCKVIYVARNPKDVAVSYYHLCRLYKTQGFVGDFERFWDYFENGYFAWLPFWEHIKEGWAHRSHPNVLFLFYEDMVKALPKTLQKLAHFLGKELTSEGIENLVNHLNIANFKNNPAINGQEMHEIGILNKGVAGFIRNGVSVDGWQPEYSEKLKKRAEKWIDENMQKYGIEFPKSCDS